LKEFAENNFQIPLPPFYEREGVKKSEYRPSPYPLPPGERVKIMKQEKNPLPLEGGGEGGGDLGDYFTASGGRGRIFMVRGWQGRSDPV